MEIIDFLLIFKKRRRKKDEFSWLCPCYFYSSITGKLPFKKSSEFSPYKN